MTADSHNNHRIGSFNKFIGAEGTAGGYFTQSLPAFQRKVYHPKGGVEAFSNLVNFFGS